MAVGIVWLVVTLTVATVAGFVLRQRSGRFRAGAASAQAWEPAVPAAPAGLLTAEDLRTGLGERATLVQFSTAFCAPCRPARQILAQVAEMTDGVKHVDIDATTRLDLVRRLRIMTTPTVLVLGQAGQIACRASGLPRKADVIAALGAVLGGVRTGSGSDSWSESE